MVVGFHMLLEQDTKPRPRWLNVCSKGVNFNTRVERHQRPYSAMTCWILLDKSEACEKACRSELNGKIAVQKMVFESNR